MFNRLRILHPRLKGYNKFYEDSIRPELQADESERKVRVRFGLLLAAILTPPSLWLGWYYGFAVDDPDSRAMYGAAMIPMLGYMLAVRALRRRTKIRLVKSISQFLNWTHADSIDQSALVERLNYFGLLPKHHSNQVGDALRGKHEDWPFEMCELVLTKNEGWGQDRRAVVVFRGAILSFVLAVESPAVTMITRVRDMGPPKSGTLIRYEASYEDNIGEVFVRSSDPESVATVMCSRFKHIIEDLEGSSPDRYVSCLLDRHYLHIPISASDKFELDWMFDPMDSSPRVQKMLDEFSEVLHLLDVVLKRRACRNTGEIDYPIFRRYSS